MRYKRALVPRLKPRGQAINTADVVNVDFLDDEVWAAQLDRLGEIAQALRAAGNSVMADALEATEDDAA